MKKRILSFILTIAMLVGLITTNIFSITATAAAATTVTLTDNSGNQTVITAEANTVGTGYTYDAETNTLTLNNWTGKKIQANGDLKIHLKGTNTITMADPASGYAYGIHVGINSALYNLDVTADEGAVLHINGTDLTKSAYGIAAHTTFHTGTVNVNITGSGGIYGIYGNTTFAEGETAPMTLNVTVTDTDTDNNDSTVGMGNGSLKIQNCANDITINIVANTMEAKATRAKAITQSLYVYNSAPVITATAKRIGATTGDGTAYDGNPYNLGLNEGGKITFNGYVRVYDATFRTNINTVTTTPANDGYFWEQDKDIDTSNYYYAKDATTGNTLNKVVFAYSETPEPIRYYGESRFRLSGMKVGNSYQSDYFRLYLTGLSTNATNGSIRYSIESGTLPEGLTISTYSGYVSGTPTAPCAAGSVTVKVTDTMGTTSDKTDDRFATFVIHYDAVTTNKPVTGLALDKDSLVLDKNGTGTVIATVTPSDASYTNLSIGKPYGFTVTASEAVEGVITLTVTAGTTAGVYVIGVTTIDTGLEKTFTVYVKESTPKITLDADDNYLRGFSIGATYKISADGVADYTFTADEYSYIALLPEWAGKTLTVIRTNAEANCNSDPCTVSVETKSVSVSNGTGSGDYIVGSIVTVVADEPATGYNFAGWTGTEGLTFVGGYQPSQKTIKFYMPDEDINLEATYTLKTYTVSFDANGGTGSMADATGVSGDYVLPVCGFTAPNGKQFKAWSVGGVEKAAGDTITVNANTVIKAVWNDTRFDFVGANMTLGNELAMNFFIKKSDIDAEKDYYIKVTKTYADGREDVVKIFDENEWLTLNNMYYVQFNGVAAKEMNDAIFVQVFYDDDTAASQLWEDSVAGYAMRIMENQNAKTKTMLVDMLNYGAAAQQHFGYDEGNLANSKLNETQKGYASQSASVEDHRIKGENYYGSNLDLGNNLVLNVYFTNSSTDMYAIVSFTDHYGTEQNVRIEGSEFIKYNSTTYAVPITAMVVADARCIVSCQLYTAGGTLVGSASDSMESYIARMNETGALYESIMKFADSAYAYFHN